MLVTAFVRTPRANNNLGESEINQTLCPFTGSSLKNPVGAENLLRHGIACVSRNPLVLFVGLYTRETAMMGKLEEVDRISIGPKELAAPSSWRMFSLTNSPFAGI
jgi:hypothetical protein